MRVLYNIAKIRLVQHGWALEDMSVIGVKGGFGYRLVASRDTRFGNFPRPITDLGTMPGLIHKLRVNDYILTVETDYHTSVEDLTFTLINLA